MSREKPTRNELIGAVSSELFNLRVRPLNPANILLQGEYALDAEKKVRMLAEILGQMIPHIDNGGTLDFARELWSEYEKEHKASEGS